MKLTPLQALMYQVQTRPQSTAFVFHEDVWTYERLASESARLAGAFAARGVKAGNRVALHMINRPEMIVAYYACFQLGAIAAPLRTAFTAAELVTLLRRLGATLYLGEMNLYHNVDLIHDAILPQDRRFVLDAARDDVDVQPWELLFEEADNEPSFASSDLQHPAVLINTSGTTGQPKFVMHSADTFARERQVDRRSLGHVGYPPRQRQPQTTDPLRHLERYREQSRFYEFSHFHSYRARITLSRARVCGGLEVFEFTRLTISYPAGGPGGRKGESSRILCQPLDGG